MMSNFKFSPRLIAALVMGVGVSLSANADLGNIKVLSIDSQKFEGEIPVVGENMPDSVDVQVVEGSSFYGESIGNDVKQQNVNIKTLREGNRILVSGIIPKNSDKIGFSLRVSWPGRTMVRDFSIKSNDALIDIDNASKSNVGNYSLGDLQVLSSINKPLLIDIDAGHLLHKNSKVEVNVYRGDLSEKLDSALSDMQYRVKKLRSGRYVVRLKSSESFSNPILPLRINVVIDGVSLERTYTVLLNPEGYKLSSKNKAIATTNSSSRFVSTNDIDAHTESRQKIHAKSYASKISHKRSILHDYKKYKVVKGDSVYKIAKEIIGNGGIGYRMNVLKDLNPRAFINNDINMLRAGAFLHYPNKWVATNVNDSVAKLAKSSIGQSTTKSILSKKSAYVFGSMSKKVALSNSHNKKLDAIQKNSNNNQPINPIKTHITEPLAGSVAKFAPSSDSDLKKLARVKELKLQLAKQDAQLLKQNGRMKETKIIASDLSKSIGIKQVSSVNSSDEVVDVSKQNRVAELKLQLAKQDSQLKKADQLAAELKLKIGELSSADSINKSIDSNKNQNVGLGDNHGDDSFALASDYRFIGFGSAAGIALIIIGLYALRRRRNRANELDYESLDGMTGESSSLALTTLMTTNNSTNNSSSDSTDSLVDAEKLLNDGKVSEALDVLRGGLAREPMRQDVRLYLLGILAKNNDPHAFVEEALVAKTLFGINSPLWQRTIELAHTIDPVPGLFASNGNVEPSSSHDSNSSEPIGIF